MTEQRSATPPRPVPPPPPPPKDRAPQTPPDAAAHDAGPDIPPGPASPNGTPRLNAALAAVQAQLPAIEKGETAEVENKAGVVLYTYQYADLADVSEAIVPLLGQNGLAFTAWPTLLDDGRTFVLAYSLLHESGEERSGKWPLPGNIAPQQLGSHITYARRYCLCAVTGVAPAGQDDDGAAAQSVPIGQRGNGNGHDQVDADVAQARAAISREWSRVGRPELGSSVVDHYAKWTNGGNVMAVDAAELRRYLAFLSTLPDRASSEPAKPAAADAQQGPGGDAGDSAAAGARKGSKPAQGRTERPQDPAAPGTINTAMRTKLQALLVPMYGKDRARKIAFLQQWADRGDAAPAIESTNDLSWDEARALIKELEDQEKTAPATPPADDTQSEA